MLNSPHRQKLNSDYTLLDIIGTSDIAEVHRGRLIGKNDTEKIIAIKRIFPHIIRDQDLAELLTNEVRLAALLQHKNIIKIFDYGERGNSFFIVMEYLIGQDLASTISQLKKQQARFTPELALHIIEKICDGMDYAHRLQDMHGTPLHVIHGNLTPHNIFLTYKGDVKIMDFGIAKTTAFNSSVNAGVIRGKMNYMSPEKVMGEKTDHRSDIFSIGVLLYEMLSGNSFYKDDTEEIIQKSVRGNHVPLQKIAPALSVEIYSFVNKAVQPEVDKRYQSFCALGKDIKNYLATFKTTTGSNTLQIFLQNCFRKEYEKDTIDSRQTSKLDSRHNDQSSCGELTDFSIQLRETKSKSMRYAQKNPTKDTLTIQQQKSSEKETTKARVRKSSRNRRKKDIPVNRKTQSKKLSLQNLKPNIIPVKDTSNQGGKNDYPHISIGSKEQSGKKRSRTGPNVSRIIKSFLPVLIFILLTVSGIVYYLKDRSPKTDTIDYFANVSPPSLPSPPDLQVMNTSQREILIFKLLLQGESALNQGKLISPVGKNAFIFINQAKQLSPQDENVETNFKRLVQMLAHQADVAIQQGKKEWAAELIVTGLSIAPEDSKLKSLKQELTK